MSEPVKKIHAAICRIMVKMDPVAKSGVNTKQGYAYRKIEDVYAALQKIMGEEGVHATSEIISQSNEERRTASGGVLIYRVLHERYYFWSAEDGSCVSSDVIGEGMDSGDKASNKAMSASDKYSLIRAFKIPTDHLKDSETEDHELKPSADANPNQGQGFQPVARPAQQAQQQFSGSKDPNKQISEKQTKFMYVKAKQAGWTDQDMNLFTSAKFGVNNWRSVNMGQFDQLLAALSGPPPVQNNPQQQSQTRQSPPPIQQMPNYDDVPLPDLDIPFG